MQASLGPFDAVTRQGNAQYGAFVRARRGLPCKSIEANGRIASTLTEVHDESLRMSGLLVYIMGPSGAGKDSLIDAARPALQAAGVHVARRVITRSAESAGEQAVGVSADEFTERLRNGEFALHWQANGLDYGIAADMSEKLGRGEAVLVNGSRAHLPQALQAYAHCLPILIEVNPGVLRERLLRRGRETLVQIEQRLARSAQMPVVDQVNGVKIERLDNSSDLESAVERLLQLLHKHGVVVGGGASAQ